VTKSARVIGLAEDIARSMSATAWGRRRARPNVSHRVAESRRETVLLRRCSSRTRSGEASTAPLALGKSINGDPVIVDLARMPICSWPHYRVGKSWRQAMVLSMHYNSRPRIAGSDDRP